MTRLLLLTALLLAAWTAAASARSDGTTTDKGLSMTDDRELAAAQAVADITSAMAREAGEALRRHGNDPNSPAILSTAVVLFIKQVTQNIDPTFKDRVLEGLKPDLR